MCVKRECKRTMTHEIVALMDLVRQWRRCAATSTGWRARVQDILASELENELAARRVSTRPTLRLADDWERHARQLRESKRFREGMSSTLRRALVEPQEIAGADERAKVFMAAATELREVLMEDRSSR